MVDLILAYLNIDLLCIKIANKINKEFVIKTKVKQIIFQVIVVDNIDKIDEFNEINKYKRIFL